MWKDENLRFRGAINDSSATNQPLIMNVRAHCLWSGAGYSGAEAAQREDHRRNHRIVRRTVDLSDFRQLPSLVSMILR